MSAKTIEVHSAKFCNETVSLCTRRDEQRKVEFTDRGDGIGKALVDEDEAEILIGCIGLPEFFKPGFEVDEQAEKPLTAEEKKAAAKAAKEAAKAAEELAAKEAAEATANQNQ
jgi:hypothetical protein